MSPQPARPSRRRASEAPAKPPDAPTAAFEVRQGLLVVRPAGEFAEYVEDLMHDLGDRITAEPRSVILNFGGVTYISSRGLGLVFDLYKRLNKAGRKLYLAAPTESVAEVFDVAGLTEVLAIFPSEEAALAAAAGGAAG
jgi:anti-anti-sigma factor